MKLKSLLTAVIILTAFWNTCAGQDTTLKKCFTNSEYKQLLKEYADGTKALLDLPTYVEENTKLRIESAALQREVARKEDVIKAQIAKNKTCYQATDSLLSIIRSKDFILDTKTKQLERAQKPDKKFAFGLVGGYGYGLGAVVQRTAFVGVGINYTLFKF